ncbi:MAG TPA: hypothetical protein VIJ36_10375 [Thermoanaerobaculia bacterium]
MIKWGYNPDPHKTETTRPLAQRTVEALRRLIDDFRARGAAAASWEFIGWGPPKAAPAR